MDEIKKDLLNLNYSAQFNIANYEEQNQDLSIEIDVIDLKEDEKEVLCKAAQGLTLQEAENAFARAMVSKGQLTIKELDVILDGITNNVDVEKSLLDFGIRSGLDDIISFANVFETCYRKGGNIKDVIKNTQQIITEKMEVEMEIQTIVAGAKNEQMIMTVMPIALIAIIKMMSPEFAANFATPSGIISTTIAVVMFIVAYFVGNIVLAIKI